MSLLFAYDINRFSYDVAACWVFSFHSLLEIRACLVVICYHNLRDLPFIYFS